MLALRLLPGMDAFFRAWYALGRRRLTRLAMLEGVQAVYLRRGAGQGELVAGASDLDFFLVIPSLSAEAEMKFLQRFWAGYHRLRRFFPFLGEVLMGDAGELRQWLASGTVRAFETTFSWQLLAGRNFLEPPASPALRDVFSECLKLYSDLLQPLLKLRPEDFRAGLRPYQHGSIQLRHAAKAAVDLLRLQAQANGASLTAGRLPACRALGLEELIPLLQLRGKLGEPFPLFSALAHRAFLALHELATRLAQQEEEQIAASLLQAAPAPVDQYSLSVRELFAERILFRHPAVSRIILSEATSGQYLLAGEAPGLEEFRELLLELREVGFSFDRFSVAMPLTEATFREMERTSLLDSPFHAFSGHREVKLENGMPLSSPHAAPPVQIPLSVLRKTFSELCFGLRLEPREMNHFLDKIVSVVLGLRLVKEQGEISTDLSRSLERYGARFPNRVGHLRAAIQPYLPTEEENTIWGDLYARLEQHASAPASALRFRFDGMRLEARERAVSATRPSDLWINLTPFLRMEMNAMKDHFHEKTPELRL